LYFAVLVKIDLKENLNIACSAQTVESEIRSPKHDFHIYQESCFRFM